MNEKEKKKESVCIKSFKSFFENCVTTKDIAVVEKPMRFLKRVRKNNVTKD